MAIEMFVTKTGQVLVNEIAPRPHNSGHHTIEGDLVSQFEQHLRGILDLPLSPTKSLIPAAMVNLLGSEDGEGPVEYEDIEASADIFGAKFHLYGKQKSKPFRKMGHVTVLDKEMKEARRKAELIREKLVVRPARAKKSDL
jgi:5-(carboxyamino)imidazole ribonucleotide synthase